MAKLKAARLRVPGTGRALSGLDREAARDAGPVSPVISGLFAPWGVQVAGSFSKAAALGEFARAERAYAKIIGGMEPFILGSVWRSRGFRPFYRVRIGAQTRAEAQKLCNRLLAAGGACAVLRS